MATGNDDDQGAQRRDGRPTPAVVRRCRDAVTERSDPCDRDEDRRAILSRRSRFIALALSGLASAGTAGCYDGHGRGDDAGIEADAGVPVPCLSPPLEDGGGPVPCLGVPIEDAGPTPCLEPPYDAGPAPVDAGPAPVGDAGTSDAGEPVPCLTIIRPAS